MLCNTCGHKEKMSAFKARREKEGGRREQKGCTEVFETAKRRAGEYCICRCIREVETVKTEMIVIILTIMCFGKNVNRYSQRES